MKKLFAAVAVLAPVLVLLPVTPANADNVCLPITIDGQPVCEDTAPVDQALVNAETTVLAAAEEVLTVAAAVEGIAVGAIRSVAGPEYDGIAHCDGITELDDGVVVSVGNYVPPPTPHADNVVGQCDGYELTIEASAGTGVTPVHVPQICVTTTATCVGGVDFGAPTPMPSYSVCLRSYSEIVQNDGSTDPRTYRSGPFCTPAG